MLNFKKFNTTCRQFYNKVCVYKSVCFRINKLVCLLALTSIRCSENFFIVFNNLFLLFDLLYTQNYLFKNSHFLQFFINKYFKLRNKQIRAVYYLKNSSIFIKYILIFDLFVYFEKKILFMLLYALLVFNLFWFAFIIWFYKFSFVMLFLSLSTPIVWLVNCRINLFLIFFFFFNDLYFIYYQQYNKNTLPLDVYLHKLYYYLNLNYSNHAELDLIYSDYFLFLMCLLC